MRYVLKNTNSPTKFTTEQIDVLNGLMLGDGSLEMHEMLDIWKEKYRGENYRLISCKYR